MLFINLASNEEQRLYSLKVYVKSHCQTLQLSGDSIAQSVIQLLQIIFNYDRSKRSNVKDGLFIVCLHWVLRTQMVYRSIDELRTKLAVDQKYISKAQSLFIEVAQKERERHPFFNKVLMIMAEKNIVTDFLDKYSFILLSEFGLTLSDIQKIEAVIKKFDELSKFLNCKSQNGSKTFVYTPKSIIVGCIFFYCSDSYSCELITRRFGSSPTSIKRICNEITKALRIKDNLN